MNLLLDSRGPGRRDRSKSLTVSVNFARKYNDAVYDTPRGESEWTFVSDSSCVCVSVLDC